jgi:hypothetical protein
MSPLLRGEAALLVASKSIGKLPYFCTHEVENSFLASAALSTKPAIFSLREYIPIEHLNIIECGIAAKEGRLKIKGGAVGFDMILAEKRLRDWSPVVALTVVVQVVFLDKQDLLDILVDAPKARRAMRMAAVRIALQRLVMRVADEYRRHMVSVACPAGREMSGRGHLFQRLTMQEGMSRALARADHELALREAVIQQQQKQQAQQSQQNQQNQQQRIMPPMLAMRAAARQTQSVPRRMVGSVADITDTMNGARPRQHQQRTTGWRRSSADENEQLEAIDDTAKNADILQPLARVRRARSGTTAEHRVTGSTHFSRIPNARSLTWQTVFNNNSPFQRAAASVASASSARRFDLLARCPHSAAGC